MAPHGGRRFGGVPPEPESDRIRRMKIRPAKADDAKAICGIINYYAERGRMLHRSLESVYEALREFQVAADESGAVVGCVAVDVYWGDLAELKSLAVAPSRRGGGIGTLLVRAALRDARRLGLRRLFALTYEKGFFARAGFRRVRRESLPEKVWRECMGCPKSDHCDEIAMILDLPPRVARGKRAAANGPPAHRRVAT
jgi:amino-acid N-acetyltransferase